MPNQKYVLILFLSVLFMCPTYSQTRTKITGVYSNLEYIKENGDVVGMEINIVYSTDGTKGQHYALVQEAEGVPTPPVLVQVSVNKDEIEFSISSQQSKRTFRGKIGKKELVGKFDGKVESIHLKRKKGYWQ